MKLIQTIAIALSAAVLPACVSNPTDPAELAAWEAEKAARTASRAKAPGSVLPGSSRATEDASVEFERFREAFQPDGDF